jgi:hypothetical protein
MDIVKHISNLVENQFPAFYQEEGRDFIYFVKKYYEFLEEENGVITDSRSLFDYSDIDKTKEEFLKYFVNKYMNGIPLSMLGDKRFIEKNILDLYRSKGSIEGIRLLFRLLYNEEIQMYIPQYDMLRPSDGKWIRNFYLEVEENEYNKFYQGEFITGSNSRATALVETVETRIVNGRPVHSLFLSNIKGTFFEDELILTDAIVSTNSSRVIGSVQYLQVINGRANYSIGDRFYATNGQGKYLAAVVNDLSKARGIINFSIVNGGTGYSSNAVITISNGSSTTGSGASFVISGLSNTSVYFYDSSIIAPYTGVLLSSVPFGGPYAWLSSSNVNSIIGSSLNISSVTIGTISSITVTNPGIGYNGDIVVSITDPYTSTSPYSLGNNAIVIGTSDFLNGIVSELRVVDSGFGYYDNNEILTFKYDSDPTRTITAKVVTGGVGYSEGYWRGTDSFLNSDKVIQDSYYYQEYSYEIRSSRAFDKYIDVLRRISHPAGNMPFGRAVLTTIDEEPIIKIYEDIRQFTTVFMTMSGDAAIVDKLDVGKFYIPTTLDPFNANYCIVSLNGVTQHVSEYTTSNKLVTLSPTIGDRYDVRTFDSTVIDIKTAQFVGNGIVNTFALGTPLPVDEQDVIVTINGIIQHTDQYHILGKNTTFNGSIVYNVVLNTPPAIGDSILLRTFTVKAPNIATQDIIVVDRYAGNGVNKIFNTQLAISEEQYALITINGVIQHTDVYSINSSNEIELVTPPAVGDNIEIRTFRQNIKV